MVLYVVSATVVCISYHHENIYVLYRIIRMFSCSIPRFKFDTVVLDTIKILYQNLYHVKSYHVPQSSPVRYICGTYIYHVKFNIKNFIICVVMTTDTLITLFIYTYQTHLNI